MSIGTLARGCGALLASAALLTACEDSSETDTGRTDGPATELAITRDFGRTTLSLRDRVSLNGRATLLRQLRDSHAVELANDGWQVEAIDGLQSDFYGTDSTVWLPYVNGVETDIRFADYGLHNGDVVQWDLRDWDTSLGIRATVGAFPQTFTRGVFGRTFPVEVVCARPGSRPCRQVERALRDAGVRIDGAHPPGAPLPPERSPQRAEVRVGEWRDLQRYRWSDRIKEGPTGSGIFARFAPDGRSLGLFDWNGQRVRNAGAGTGLIGAFRPTEPDLVWVVTGVDATGVKRAANALQPDTLRDAMAVAITTNRVEKLPLPPAKRP